MLCNFWTCIVPTDAKCSTSLCFVNSVPIYIKNALCLYYSSYFEEKKLPYPHIDLLFNNLLSWK
jgi:hypothetical protein